MSNYIKRINFKKASITTLFGGLTLFTCARFGLFGHKKIQVGLTEYETCTLSQSSDMSEGGLTIRSFFFDKGRIYIRYKNGTYHGHADKILEFWIIRPIEIERKKVIKF